ncbi:hypothetical protein NEOCIP111885_04058 [Pseudoneobacillus rhizosphaerae]|uniref:Uncharacterized protein n=2 Tax=Pseudoneobacillus rhizosphaerae TaxID=2880968 RepID=A0A9C7GDG8_9BACI|nr:hypothetical protein NEOCIP111885_04058 [Pseudoneobacillus rhizosphaerae]
MVLIANRLQLNLFGVMIEIKVSRGNFFLNLGHTPQGECLFLMIACLALNVVFRNTLKL